jgi:DNA helicase HerA-like ATPase
MTSAKISWVDACVDAGGADDDTTVNVPVAEKLDPVDTTTVYVPGLNNGTRIDAVRLPLRSALGAGLGNTFALPIVKTFTVTKELKPVPLISMMSSTDA